MEMMRRYEILMITMTLMFLGGCTTLSAEVTIYPDRLESPTPLQLKFTSTSTTSQQINPTTHSSPTAIAIETPEPTTISNQSSVIPTEKLMDQVVDTIPMCRNYELAATPLTTMDLPGILIYQNLEMQELVTISKNSIVPKTLPVLGDGAVYFHGLSLDDKWLAYSQTGFFGKIDLLVSKPIIRLLSEMGQNIEQVVEMGNFQPLVERFHASHISGWRASSTRWVGNKLLPMSVAIVTETTTNMYTEVVYGLLNPFSGEWDNDIYSELPGWEPNYYVAFSPDMGLALYASEQSNRIVLWDIMNREILWEKPNLNLYTSGGEVYQWSLDGSRAAYLVSIEEGITSLLRDGTEVLLRKIIFSDPINCFLIGFQLSRDGNLVALLYRLYNPDLDTEKLMLYIYDFRKELYTLRCPIPSNSGDLIFWSPDNQFLTFGARNLEVAQESIPLLILDYNDGLIYQLEYDGSSVEWIESFPNINP
jgi:hypothetical protein